MKALVKESQLTSIVVAHRLTILTSRVKLRSSTQTGFSSPMNSCRFSNDHLAFIGGTMSKHNYVPLAAALVFSCLVGYGQQSTFGSLVGNVQDKSGATVPGAQVATTNLDTGAMRTVLSSDTGQYELLELPAGRYSLTVAKPGFGVVRIPEISLDARQERRTNVAMDVAATSETVQVEATATAINTEDGKVSQSVNGQAVEDLPANYRGSTTSPLGAIVALPH